MTNQEKKKRHPSIFLEVEGTGAVPEPLLTLAKVYMVQAATALRDMEGAIGEMRKEADEGSPMNEGVAHAVIIRNAATDYLSAVAWLDAMTVYLDMERHGLGTDEQVVVKAPPKAAKAAPPKRSN